MHQDLIKAKQRSNNEFYTPYDTIKEYMQEAVKHYDFTNKTVYCNCDDYRASEFCKFFINNFHTLELNKLIVTGFPVCGNYSACAYVYDGINKPVSWLMSGDKEYDAGDYRSVESKRFLEEADIVITNPPFSVFCHFYKTIRKKDFIIIGPLTSLIYVDVFNDIKANKCYNSGFHFNIKANKCYNSGFDFKIKTTTCEQTCVWLTSFPCDTYKPIQGIKYCDLDLDKNPYIADGGYILIKTCKEIPMDYYEPVAVPCTFLEKDYSDYTILGLVRPKGFFIHILVQKRR